MRSADELVATERDDIGAKGQSFARRRLVQQPELLRVKQGTRSKVIDDDRSVLVGQPGHCRRIRLLDEARHREVGRMDPQHDPRIARAKWRFEVRGACAIRGPDLDQARSRTFDDLGDPDAATDLDELAARHDDAARTRQADGDGDGRRVVVDDHRGTRTGQGDEVVLRQVEPWPASSGLRVELEHAPPSGQTHGLDCDIGPGRSSEIGVEDHARRVDHRLRDGGVWIEVQVEQLFRGVGHRLDRPRRLTRTETGALVIDRRACDGDESTRLFGVVDDLALALAQYLEYGLDAGRARVDDRLRRHRSSMAGTRGSRTHHATPSAASPVLKTGGPTGTRPLPTRW